MSHNCWMPLSVCFRGELIMKNVHFSMPVFFKMDFKWTNVGIKKLKTEEMPVQKAGSLWWTNMESVQKCFYCVAGVSQVLLRCIKELFLWLLWRITTQYASCLIITDLGNVFFFHWEGRNSLDRPNKVLSLMKQILSWSNTSFIFS